MAGADIFLMPSLYEPCGLTQMRSQRYGAPPVVRNVGGLRDTVEDGVTGFSFDRYTSEAFSEAAFRAVERYADPPRWEAMMRAGMARDFSWERSVSEYLEVYRRALIHSGPGDRSADGLRAHAAQPSPVCAESRPLAARERLDLRG